jgi:LmbE family N-acetylglucosaminyl deacetylase
VTRARVTRLGFLDNPYRHRADDSEAIAASIARVIDPRAVLWAPMGIGGHPDHLAVRDAMLRLPRPTELRIYADSPYASAAGWDDDDDAREPEFQWTPHLERLSAAGLSLSRHVVHLSTPLAVRKVGLVRHHASQLSELGLRFPRLLDVTGGVATEVWWRATPRT